jgi:ribose-phosphate pyrophosphokinase
MTHQETIYVCATENAHDLPKKIIEELKRKHEHVEEIKSTVVEFKNGEQKAVIETSVRQKDIVLISTMQDHIDKEVLRLVFYIDALRRSGAASISVILPYYYYERQDKTTDSRESINASLLGKMYELAGMSQLTSVHLHNNAIEGFMSVPVDKIGTKKLFWDYLKTYLESQGETLDPEEWVICSPDEGAVKEGRTFAKKVGTGNAAFSKYRSGPNQIEHMEFFGDVKDKRVLLFDDMIDTGGTAVKAGNALIERHGAKEVIMAASHALLNGEAPQLLQESKFKKVFVTDSLYIASEKQFEKLQVVSLASMLAQVIINSKLGESIRQENW